METQESVSPIISKRLLETAIAIARPTCEELLTRGGTCWGPHWVEGVVLFRDIEMQFSYGEREGWKKAWGDKVSFKEIARKKAEAAHREGRSSRELANFAPQLFLPGEYLYIGAVSQDGLTVATSGAKSETDEGISKIVLDTIMTFVHLVVQERLENDYPQL